MDSRSVKSHAAPAAPAAPQDVRMSFRTSLSAAAICFESKVASLPRLLSKRLAFEEAAPAQSSEILLCKQSRSYGVIEAKSLSTRSCSALLGKKHWASL